MNDMPPEPSSARGPSAGRARTCSHGARRGVARTGTLRSAAFRRGPAPLLAAALSLAVAGFLFPPAAAAQTTTGSIQGVVRDSLGEPLPASLIVARHLGTNFQKSTNAGENGFYRLSGLRPGDYEITASNAFFHDATHQVGVGVGQSLTLNFQLASQVVEVAEIRVTGTRSIGQETATPEVATNITPEQIEELPQSDRNFLNFAKLVPGVRSQQGSITSGPARDENINVFIDGTSFKNDILQGGVVGQDASSGNPFPQNAVAGFRVITQQYKAEYQKATSAIITATTKSGTNEWQGTGFGLFTDEGLAATDFLTDRRMQEEAPFSRWQAGGSIGGPIIRDRLFMFLSYEGNFQDQLTNVTLGDQVPTHLREFEDAPGVDIPQDLSSLEGTFGVPFTSNLFFGKLTWQPESRHTIDLSLNVRDEKREGGFGGRATAQLREEFFNNVTAAILKHQWDVSDDLLNEVIVNYLDYRFNPEPVGDGVSLEFRSWGNIGVRCCAQDKSQERFGIRDDITWTVPDFGGLHVVKGGAYVDFNRYDMIQENFVNPVFIFREQDSAFPEEALFAFGDPRVAQDNTAFGLYIQDDWSPSDRLILNLGVRWDVETNAKNNDFVTPESVRNALGPLVDAEFRETFFTDGGERDPWLGAVQPRFGFSYALRDVEGNQTVLFGGAGLYYDRTPADWLRPEFFRLQRQVLTFRFSETGEPDEGGNPTIAWEDRFLSREGLQQLVDEGLAPEPEVFLLDNDLRPPRSFQGSIGVRQTVGDFLFSLNYTGVRGWDDMVFWFFHRCTNMASELADCTQIDPPGFGNVLASTQETRTWFDAFYFKGQKRFSEDSPWGVQLAYTLGFADNEPNLDNQFEGLCCISPTEFERQPSSGDERHRITFNWIVRLPVDIMFSGIGSFGTGTPFDLRDPSQPRESGEFPLFCSAESTQGNCVPGTRNEGRAPSTVVFQGEEVGIGFFEEKQVDIRFQKRFQIRGGYAVSVQAEVLDLFDWTVFTGFEGNVQSDNFLQPFNTDGITRRLQLGAEVEFGGF